MAGLNRAINTGSTFAEDRRSAENLPSRSTTVLGSTNRYGASLGILGLSCIFGDRSGSPIAEITRHSKSL